MAAPVTLKVSLFALAVMGAYTWYANSIPQIESKPPEELSLEGRSLDCSALLVGIERRIGPIG